MFSTLSGTPTDAVTQSRESQGATKTYKPNHRRAVRGIRIKERDQQPKEGVNGT